MKRTALRRKSPLRAKKSLGAYHLDRLRREQKATGRKTLARSEVPDEVRAEVLLERKACCELCADPPYGERNVMVHHVFYRSAVCKQVRHEKWNLAILHPGCHTLVHRGGGRRGKLERAAKVRLLAHLGVKKVAAVLALVPVGATDDAAFVRAYEQWSRRAA